MTTIAKTAAEISATAKACNVNAYHFEPHDRVIRQAFAELCSAQLVRRARPPLRPGDAQPWHAGRKRSAGRRRWGTTAFLRLQKRWMGDRQDPSTELFFSSPQARPRLGPEQRFSRRRVEARSATVAELMMILAAGRRSSRRGRGRSSRSTAGPGSRYITWALSAPTR